MGQTTSSLYDRIKNNEDPDEFRRHLESLDSNNRLYYNDTFGTIVNYACLKSYALDNLIVLLESKHMKPEYLMRVFRRNKYESNYHRDAYTCFECCTLSFEKITRIIKIKVLLDYLKKNAHLDRHYELLNSCFCRVAKIDINLAMKMLDEELILEEMFNYVNRNGDNILLLTCYYHRSNQVKKIIDHDFLTKETFTCINKNKSTAFNIVCSKFPDLIDKFINHRFMTSELFTNTDNFNNTAFMEVCRYNPQCIELFLNSKFMNEEYFNKKNLYGDDAYIITYKYNRSYIKLFHDHPFFKF